MRICVWLAFRLVVCYIQLIVLVWLVWIVVYYVFCVLVRLFTVGFWCVIGLLLLYVLTFWLWLWLCCLLANCCLCFRVTLGLVVCLGVIWFLFAFVCFVSLIALLEFVFVRFVVNCFGLVLCSCMMISFGYLVMLSACVRLILWCLFCLLWLIGLFAVCYLVTRRLLRLRLTCVLFDLVSNCVFFSWLICVLVCWFVWLCCLFVVFILLC